MFVDLETLNVYLALRCIVVVEDNFLKFLCFFIIRSFFLGRLSSKGALSVRRKTTKFKYRTDTVFFRLCIFRCRRYFLQRVGGSTKEKKM